MAQRIDHLTAVAYVREHFATHDYGFQPVVTGVGYTAGDDDIIEVTFRCPGAEPEGNWPDAVFSVWMEQFPGEPPFVYGEW